MHEFYRLKALITLEQANTTEWSKKIRILINKTAMVGYGIVNFHCMQMGLVMSMRFIWAMIEMTSHVNHSFDLWQRCNFSGIEALEFSCIYTRV